MARRGLIALILLWTAASTAAEPRLPDPLRQFLGGPMGWPARDLEAVRAGAVVVSLPDTAETRELSALGVIHVAAPSSALVGAVSDIETFKRGDGVLQIGRFSNPPQAADLRALTLEPGDLEALRNCRVGSCGLKLSAAMIQRFQRDVRWEAPDWRQRAAALFREQLAAYVGAYLRDGNDALIEYVDKDEPLRLAEEARALIRQTPYVRTEAPAFLAALDARASPARRLVYWSKEQYGYKPTVSVTELSVYGPAGDGGAVFVASKQIYATHYFEGSLGISVATPAGPAPGDGVFLMHLNRSRIDSLRGRFGSVKRAFGLRRLRRAMEDSLRQAKARIEAFRG